jgi:hypothetical protein
MEQSSMSYLIHIPPKYRLKLSVSFAAWFENAVGVFEHSTGGLLKGFNNYFGGGGEWDSGDNNTEFTRTIRLEGSHKEGEPDSSLPWIESMSKILFNDGHGNYVIGFEDAPGHDADYNDARVAVQLRPIPGKTTMEERLRTNPIPSENVSNPEDPKVFTHAQRIRRS